MEIRERIICLLYDNDDERYSKKSILLSKMTFDVFESFKKLAGAHYTRRARGHHDKMTE